VGVTFTDGTQMRITFATVMAYNALRNGLEAVRDVVWRQVRERTNLYR
jgi:hypothetical protein